MGKVWVLGEQDIVALIRAELLLKFVEVPLFAPFFPASALRARYAGQGEAAHPCPKWSSVWTRRPTEHLFEWHERILQFAGGDASQKDDLVPRSTESESDPAPQRPRQKSAEAHGTRWKSTVAHWDTVLKRLLRWSASACNGKGSRGEVRAPAQGPQDAHGGGRGGGVRVRGDERLLPCGSVGRSLTRSGNGVGR